MSARNLTWSTEQLPEGVLRLAFAGTGGIGSEGIPDGEWMRDVIRHVLAEHRPFGLVIDLSGFEYRYGDWIVSVPVTALRALGRGRVCLLATGDTGVAIRELWYICRLGQAFPAVGESGEARRYFWSARLRPMPGSDRRFKQTVVIFTSYFANPICCQSLSRLD